MDTHVTQATLARDKCSSLPPCFLVHLTQPTLSPTKSFEKTIYAASKSEDGSKVEAVEKAETVQTIKGVDSELPPSIPSESCKATGGIAGFDGSNSLPVGSGLVVQFSARVRRLLPPHSLWFRYCHCMLMYIFALSRTWMKNCAFHSAPVKIYPIYEYLPQRMALSRFRGLVWGLINGRSETSGEALFAFMAEQDKSLVQRVSAHWEGRVAWA